MRFALCQTNPTVGDLRGNGGAVVEAAQRAASQGARVAVFPELALCGYPPRDLLERPHFVAEASEAVEEIARRLPPELVTILGFPATRSGRVGRPIHNAVAVLREGRVERMVAKRLLPTYDVFDEDRYFESGVDVGIIDVDDVRLGLTICEDAWNDVPFRSEVRRYAINPIADAVQAGAQVLISVSAAPFALNRPEARARMLAAIARKHAVPLVFVNQVGGNDDLVFDGTSALFRPDGHVAAQAASFQTDLVVADHVAGATEPFRTLPVAEAARQALVLGVRDYFRKCGFSRAVLGLSGGIDSALTASIAAEALGPDHVSGIALPSRYSSDQSLEDAREVATALGIRFRTVSIDRLFQAYLDELRGPLDELGPARSEDVTFENVQARIRGNVLMALANREGSLLLTTGNKSEIACGYCTLYGDMAGALAVISDLPKTFVYRVAEAVNRRAGRDVIPPRVLTKPPSAELRPDQTDQDTLPPYEVLDGILERYVERQESSDAIVAAGFDPQTVESVLRLVRASEHKRWQMPPGLKVSDKAFGPGRRYPIAQRWSG